MSTRYKLLLGLILFAMVNGFVRGVVLGADLEGWQSSILRGAPYAMYAALITALVPDGRKS